MRVNDFFDRVCYINLDKRKDRFKRMEMVLDQNDICSMRVPAIEGNKWEWKAEHYPHPLRAFDGVAGGTSTQIEIIRQAQMDKRKSVLILEDDCGFIEGFPDLFDKWSEDVPDDWDLLYLGGMDGRGMHIDFIEKVINYIVRVTNMNSTHAYAVNQKAYQRVIDTMYESFPYLTDSADGYLRSLQFELKAYAFNPPMIWQIDDYSDIQGGRRDYSEQMKKPLM